MNIEEGFLPGFEPEKKDRDINIEKGDNTIEVKYASLEDRTNCQYCEDVGICDFCERGIAEKNRLIESKRQR
jgi:hypothetical protein